MYVFFHVGDKILSSPLLEALHTVDVNKSVSYVEDIDNIIETKRPMVYLTNMSSNDKNNKCVSLLIYNIHIFQ